MPRARESSRYCFLLRHPRKGRVECSPIFRIVHPVRVEVYTATKMSRQRERTTPCGRNLHFKTPSQRGLPRVVPRRSVVPYGGLAAAPFMRRAMNAHYEDLVNRLEQGPTFLLLGQKYLSLESHEDPLVGPLSRAAADSSGQLDLDHVLLRIKKDRKEAVLSALSVLGGLGTHHARLARPGGRLPVERRVQHRVRLDVRAGPAQRVAPGATRGLNRVPPVRAPQHENRWSTSWLLSAARRMSREAERSQWDASVRTTGPLDGRSFSSGDVSLIPREACASCFARSWSMSTVPRPVGSATLPHEAQRTCQPSEDAIRPNSMI